MPMSRPLLVEWACSTRSRDGVRLERLGGRAVGAELDRFPPGVLELRARVGRHEVAGLDPLEPVFLEERGVLCLQQSPGNSAGPEVDVAPSLLAHRLLNRDVGHLNSPARRENTMKLGEDSVLV